MNTHDKALRRRPTLGLPMTALAGLALLALPRAVLHDLHVIEEGTFVNAALVFVPPIVWIAVAVAKRLPNPFVTLLVVGAFYGVFLAVCHQLLWDANWRGDPPRLGGTMGDLAPGTESLILRTFTAVGSLFTGLIVGAICGLIAWGVGRLVGATRRD